MTASTPLTLGTAGHVDHGKTTLVAALTGVDTDRLPEEKARGLSIALGYAPLVLPDGRRLSVVDVPGHERFVRTMVAGATGVDLFVMTIAADDGVMPQTLEHAAVLGALGLEHGVVAVTKVDVADPVAALADARRLFPSAPAVACSARTGEGLGELVACLGEVATRVRPRSGGDGADAPLLHVDRAFTIRGAGVVVTGTLVEGALAVGDTIEIAPRGRRARVRGLEVHDEPAREVLAGQRVAVNLAGVRPAEVEVGDALCRPGQLPERVVLDCALRLRSAGDGDRVLVHHGTRAAPGRLTALGDDLWQLRLERPVLARDGDRVVVRRPTPPDTLGGGVVLDAGARRHGRHGQAAARLRGEAGAPAPERLAPAPTPAPEVDPGRRRALEARLRDVGPGLLRRADLAPDEVSTLAALRGDGVAVRLRGDHYVHGEVLAAVRDLALAHIEREGSLTLGDLRDALGISRRPAQALIEQLDALHVTRRLPDDRRVRSQRLDRERA